MPPSPCSTSSPDRLHARSAAAACSTAPMSLYGTRMKPGGQRVKNPCAPSRCRWRPESPGCGRARRAPMTIVCACGLPCLWPYMRTSFSAPRWPRNRSWRKNTSSSPVSAQMRSASPPARGCGRLLEVWISRPTCSAERRGQPRMRNGRAVDGMPASASRYSRPFLAGEPTRPCRG